MLAPWPSFTEDNFCMDWGVGDGFRMIQAHYIQAHLLLCCQVPNRPRSVPVLGPKVEDPLVYRTNGIKQKCTEVGNYKCPEEKKRAHIKGT